jgi:hypothetical protein
MNYKIDPSTIQEGMVGTYHQLYRKDGFTVEKVSPSKKVITIKYDSGSTGKLSWRKGALTWFPVGMKEAMVKYDYVTFGQKINEVDDFGLKGH